MSVSMDVQAFNHEESDFDAMKKHAPEDSHCAYCGVLTILAQSKLHSGWSATSEHWLLDKKLPQIRAGAASNCKLCSLLVDALVALGQEDEGRVFDVVMSREECGPGGTVNVVLRGPYRKVQIFVVEATCADVESDWNLRPLRLASGNTASPQAVTTIRRWVDTCRHEHEACREYQQSRYMPKRVLSLTTEYVQLRENISSAQPYACLSHCWGNVGLAVKLVPANMEAMRFGFPVKLLPKTFRDAVKTCLDIGIHLLWIDALCIIQGDAKDWYTAAASMADVYAGATVTLAATWSDSSDCGLFSQTQDEYTAAPLQEPGLYVRAKLPSFPRHVIEQPRAAWPLLSRAWVFQERKLSARVVHFGKEQLYWECDWGMMSEDGTEDVRRSGQPSLRSRLADPGEAWRVAVTHYSVLDLTYETDRLPAISAVVRQMQPLRKGDVYAAGMWQNTLLDDLSWEPQQRSAPRPATNAPTWSWISVTGGVVWRPKTPLQAAALVKSHFTIDGPSHFGHAPNARITVRGPTSSFAIGEGFRARLPGLPEEYRTVIHGFTLHRDFDWQTAEPAIAVGETLACVLLWGTRDADPAFYFSVQGVLLRDVGEGVYQRVGQAEVIMNDLLDRFVASLPVEEFTVV